MWFLLEWLVLAVRSFEDRYQNFDLGNIFDGFLSTATSKATATDPPPAKLTFMATLLSKDQVKFSKLNSYFFN